jgi:hypothetical protein
MQQSNIIALSSSSPLMQQLTSTSYCRIVVVTTTDATIKSSLPSLSSPQMQQAHRIVIVNANVAIKLLPFHLRSFHSLLLTNQSNRHHIVVIVSTDATIKSLSPRIVDATNNSDDQEESIGCGTENRIDEVEKC